MKYVGNFIKMFLESFQVFLQVELKFWSKIFEPDLSGGTF